MKEHYIHAYIGNGKGKSTCAVGLAVRAAASGMKVLYVQLLKNGSSENKALEKLGVNMITPKVPGFLWNMSDEQKLKTGSDIKQAVDEALLLAKEEGYDMAVFDEILDAAQAQLLDEERLMAVCELHCEVVLTGRRVPAKIAPLCGYISEILPVAHPFNSRGAKPRKGIEY